ncbi:MAG: hypothetical protein EVA89_01180 [Sandaracinaceae bacterium]|nr:MAG: hypothetical protein EVA89_01180 [Sandaracinaceae bacterium]
MKLAGGLPLLCVLSVVYACGEPEPDDSPPRLSAETRRALNAPDRVELLVLGERLERPPADGFDGREVLAVFDVHASHHARVAEALDDAVAQGDLVTSCYEPHHGLRIHGGARPVELSICFHCAQLHELHVDGPYSAIAGGRLQTLLDDLIRRHTDYRFDEGQGPFGGWVSK